jgi:hexosaminidase
MGHPSLPVIDGTVRFRNQVEKVLTKLTKSTFRTGWRVRTRYAGDRFEDKDVIVHALTRKAPIRRAALKLTFAAGLLAFAALASAQSALHLIPVPREVRNVGAVSLGKGVRIVCSGCAANAEDRFAEEDMVATFQSRHISTTTADGFRIELSRSGDHPADWSDAMKPEGYVLTSAPHSLTVVGATATGLFYGVQTVKQLLEGEGAAATLHTADIRDWPAMRYRGISDDFARGPMPTVAFQKKQIRTMAAYKLNVYSLYFQHSMEYKAIPLMGPPGGGTFTQAEARELVAYAARYHITVIPEQESFGHLHYLLDWEQYSPLAETPHGDVLAPGQPTALQLTHQMFAEMASVYPGPFLHIGADETADLGKGQTKQQVDARGIGSVYLEYLQQIVTDLEPLKRKLLFWGDIAMHDPALVKQLPDRFKKSTIAVAWEYDPHAEGFAPWITPFTDAQIETWVAPGINNWSRVYPNYQQALLNIQQFTAQGQHLGATGQLNTIWDDDGESLADNNWYGILFGAEAAWHPGEDAIPVFESSYGANFHGDLTGKIDEAQKELMLASQLLSDPPLKARESDIIFWVDPWSGRGQRDAALLRPLVSQVRLHAERVIVLVAEARQANSSLRESDALDALELGARRVDFIGRKFQISDEIATRYAAALALRKSSKAEDRAEASRQLAEIQWRMRDMSENYALLRDLYQAAWLKTNRPYFLSNNLARYDFAVQLWHERIDQVREAAEQWRQTGDLPPASTLGVPTPVAAQ